MEQGFIGEGNWKARAILISEVVPGWKWQSDIGALSQQQAEDLTARLELRKEQGSDEQR
jgi:hypothetical protein